MGFAIDDTRQGVRRLRERPSSLYGDLTENVNNTWNMPEITHYSGQNH